MRLGLLCFSSAVFGKAKMLLDSPDNNTMPAAAVPCLIKFRLFDKCFFILSKKILR